MNKNYIAFVDDEESTHFLIKKILRKFFSDKNIDIKCFYHGKECFDYIKANPLEEVELVITDLNMPVMDGFELLKELKTINPKLEVLVCTAYDDTATRKLVVELGGFKLLPKPIAFDTLKNEIIAACPHLK